MRGNRKAEKNLGRTSAIMATNETGIAKSERTGKEEERPAKVKVGKV